MTESRRLWAPLFFRVIIIVREGPSSGPFLPPLAKALEKRCPPVAAWTTSYVSTLNASEVLPHDSGELERPLLFDIARTWGFGDVAR